MKNKNRFSKIISIIVVAIFVLFKFTGVDSALVEASDEILEYRQDSEPAAITETEEVFDDSYSDNAKEENYVEYRFRSYKLLNEHFEKHGMDMGFDTTEAYEEAASKVINNPSSLHKIEAEDGDDVYYLEETNEFVVLSTDGYIRTYFNPDAGKDYFDRQ